MHRATALAALAAALIGAMVGVADTFRLRSQVAEEPRWAATLAPLAAAPIDVHEVVVLALPRGVTPEHARLLLFEAAWQRPGVRWTLAADAAAADAALALAGAPPPPGWVRVWEEGDAVLWRSPRP